MGQFIRNRCAQQERPACATTGQHYAFVRDGGRCRRRLDGIATVAMPPLILGMTSNPVLVALVQVALGLPWLLFSLHA